MTAAGLRHTDRFRAYTVSSSFLLRNQLIAAHKNDTEALAAAQGVLTTISAQLRAQHKLNYEAAGRGALLDYYNHAQIKTVSRDRLQPDVDSRLPRLLFALET